jgi:hypothetical protein
MKKAIFIAALAVLSFQAEAAVDRPTRALVIVSELDTHGSADSRDLYRALESATRHITPQILGDDYGHIVRLYDKDATATKFVATLRDLASRMDIFAIDVVLSLHGSPNVLWFKEGAVGIEDLKENLLTARTESERQFVRRLKRKLRLMYNLSCYGKSVNAEFIEMGFDTSIGSRKVNANAEVEFPSVLSAWQLGIGIDAALFPTNNDASIAAHDGPLVLTGQLSGNQMLQQVNSQKVVSGRTRLTISSDPQ